MKHRKQEAIQLLNDANQLYKKGLYEEALNLFESAYKVDPLLFEAQFSVAKTYVRLGKPDLGVSLLEKALKLVSKDKNNYYVLGFISILFKNKAYNQAYNLVKPILGQKVKAEKLTALLKYPLQSEVYLEVIELLLAYKPEEIKALLQSISENTEIDKTHKEAFETKLNSFLQEKSDSFRDKWSIYDSTIGNLRGATAHKDIDLNNRIQRFMSSVENQLSLDVLQEKEKEWIKIENEIKSFQKNEIHQLSERKLKELKEKNSQAYLEYTRLCENVLIFSKPGSLSHYNKLTNEDIKLVKKEYKENTAIWRNENFNKIAALCKKLPELTQKTKGTFDLILGELSLKAKTLHKQKRFSDLEPVLGVLLLNTPNDPIFISYQKDMKKSKKRKVVKWLLLAFIIPILGVLGYFGMIYYQDNQYWTKATQENTVESHQHYINNSPEGKFVNQAQDFIERSERDTAILLNTTESLRSFIKNYPDSKYCIDVPVSGRSNARLKIRGYETLSNDFLYNDLANIESLKLVDGSKVEIQYAAEGENTKTKVFVISEESDIFYEKRDKGVLESEDKTVSETDDSPSAKDTPTAKLIPFSFVQKPPIHPDCKQKSKRLREQCFERLITKHLQSRLPIEEFRKLNLTKQQQQVPYYFEIDEFGEIRSIRVKASHKNIIENVTKSIQAIPPLKPAEQDGEKVAVSYMGTLVFVVGDKKEVAITINEDNKKVEEFIGTRIPSNLTIQMVDSAPVFPGCEGKSSVSLMKCTIASMHNFVKSNINHDNLKGKNIPKETFKSVISYTITKQGRVSNVSVQNSNEILRDEITRAVKSMPKMSPALYENIQVPINYRMTLTTTLTLEYD